MSIEVNDNSSIQTVLKTPRKALSRVFGFALVVCVWVTCSVAQADDPKETWIQYPPRAAVKLTEQVQAFKEMELEKKGVAAGELKKREEKIDLTPLKETKLESTEKPQSEEKKIEPPKPRERKLLSQDESWAQDHKTKTTTLKYDDGTLDWKVDVIEPTPGQPTYKADIQSIPMSYADGTQSIVTRKAKSVDQQWGRDHSTKTLIYKFSDGTSNIEIKNIPKKYSQPEFKNGIEKITITFGDGTQRVEENEAIDRKTIWSKDHLVQTIIYYFEDGKSFEERIETPRVLSTPIYKDDQEIIKATYGDGFTQEIIETAVDTKVSFASDHQTKTTTYIFKDGTINEVVSTIPRDEVAKSYKGNLQVLTYLYPDGTKTAVTKKAVSEKLSWSEDHLIKTLEYQFADGSVNKVVSEVKPETSKPVYKKNLQFINYKFGDGTTKSVVNKAISEDTSWSESRLYRTVTYKFADGGVSSEEFSEPQKLADKKNTVAALDSEPKVKLEADREQKLVLNVVKVDNVPEDTKTNQNNRVSPTKSAVGAELLTKKSEEFSFKNIINKFLDKSSDDEQINDHKISSNSANQPVYLQGLQIITKPAIDGKTVTLTYKAIDKEESWSNDKSKKITTYKFADGTVNKVITDVNSQVSKAPKPNLFTGDEELTRRTLADD
jgi:hypothetical protein